MTTSTAHTLDVPGAVLTHDVRRIDASTEPALLLIGSPTWAVAALPRQGLPEPGAAIAQGEYAAG